LRHLVPYLGDYQAVELADGFDNGGRVGVEEAGDNGRTRSKVDIAGGSGEAAGPGEAEGEGDVHLYKEVERVLI